jgi:hypothetical protein
MVVGDRGRRGFSFAGGRIHVDRGFLIFPPTADLSHSTAGSNLSRGITARPIKKE